MSSLLSGEMAYIALLFALFIVPRIIQRWGVPSAISSFALGVAIGAGSGLFHDDTTIALLSTFGIVSLFLFAGLEVDWHELRSGAAVLVQHLTIRLVMIAIATYAVAWLLGLSIRPAVLVALALLTPSTGFILSALDSMGGTEQERFWIRSKAVATEIVALIVLFIALQSNTAVHFASSTAILLLMIALLPLAFRLFARVVLPFAPKSDFAFLVIVAVACAVLTKQLGVYYLVGAFVVGVVAQRFRSRMPSMRTDQMLHAVESLASLFIPFYFFHAGLELRASDFSWLALGYGLAFLLVAVPFRFLFVVAHRRLALRERARSGVRIATAMMPTLVFTLVIATILREEFQIAPPIFGGLILYAVVNTLLPGLMLQAPVAEFDTLIPHTVLVGRNSGNVTQSGTDGD
ncbi:MAG: cation:proton antiporter [Steroidobacteraceae bacterium]